MSYGVNKGQLVYLCRDRAVKKKNIKKFFSSIWGVYESQRQKEFCYAEQNIYLRGL